MSHSELTENKLQQSFSFAGYRPVYKAAVRRTYPENAAGYLETVDIHEGDTFGNEEIRDLFGGGRYHIKVMNSKGQYLRHFSAAISGEPRQMPLRLRGKGNVASRLSDELSGVAYCAEDVGSLANRIEELKKKIESVVTGQEKNHDLLSSVHRLIRAKLGDVTTAIENELSATNDQSRRSPTDASKVADLLTEQKRINKNLVAMSVLVMLLFFLQRKP